MTSIFGIKKSHPINSFVLKMLGVSNNVFDRTPQFRRFVQQKTGSDYDLSRSKSAPPTKSEMLNDIKIFNKTTTSLFANINKIAAKLTKLTELAKSKSLFEEQQNGMQIQRLTSEIHQDLQRVNLDMKNAQKQSLDLHSKYPPSNQTEAHRDVVCKHLDYLLKNTTKSFTDVLQIRAESIKAQQEKKEKYIAPGQNSGVYQRNMTGFSFHDEPLGTDQNVEVDIPQSTSLTMSTEHLEERVQGVQSIERMLNDLLGLYNHITFLVTTQEEMVKRIDENTEQAVFNVEEGHSQLQDALKAVSSNRGLIVKSLLVVLFFAIVFLVFFL
ncbi:integral membrane protein sed5, putative [Entamoeba invadens IP1]|uniref:Integral membrane protein sed5, putative n=1 Tax=Entamoeba invadens IP1 TaxID=370355 RepID=A0A0A1U478_ENTIV|nr:integral membrane protein sed5, putative [Entamoeba invadens IP1]ELP89027.1 integral membrane protein sed5, putative [Entamoeba invadens IP1]|eukprot:XP_004255798.1 integral membrane protein sed5, putative [Entamoeba invadens IP1]